MTTRVKILASLLIVGVVGALSGWATYAAFSSTTSNGGNTFASGTVQLTDNDAGGAVANLSNAKPGDTATGCINVTFSGSLSSTVRLFASVTGSLAQYLNVVVTRGTDASPSFRSCANFTPDATNYIGAGQGVIYSGTLAGFPSSYASGLVDPLSASPETWTNAESHSYRFAISLQDVNAAQGLSSTATFTWEARNL